MQNKQVCMCRTRWTRGESKIHSRIRSMQGGAQGGEASDWFLERNCKVSSWTFHATSRRRARARARARAGLLELASAYLRCTLFRCLRREPWARRGEFQAIAPRKKEKKKERKKEYTSPLRASVGPRDAWRRGEKARSTPVSRSRPSREPRSISFRLRASLETNYKFQSYAPRRSARQDDTEEARKYLRATSGSLAKYTRRY